MTIFEDIGDELTDFIADPPIWATIIASVYTVGAGGLVGLLADQPLQNAVTETLRALPGLLEGKSFAAAWTGQWLARVKKAAEIVGVDFVKKNVTVPVDWLAKDAEYGRRMVSRYQELQAQGLSPDAIKGRLLMEATAQCRSVSTDPALCRADVQALAINYHLRENLFDPTGWDITTGEPARKLGKPVSTATRRDYTIAELDQLWRRAEQGGLPPPVVAALRRRHAEAVKMREFAENNGIRWGPRKFGKLTLSDVMMAPTDPPPIDTGPPTPTGTPAPGPGPANPTPTATVSGARKSLLGEIFLASLLTAPAWVPFALLPWWRRRQASSRSAAGARRARAPAARRGR